MREEGALASLGRRSLLQNRYNDNYYYGEPCYQRTGCLVGSIVGAVVFALIALTLLIVLCTRLRRRRTAMASQPAGYGAQYGNQTYAAQQPYPQQNYQWEQPPQPPAQTYGEPYPQPAAAAGFSGPPGGMTDLEREKWEREQYEKYGEAGLVQGYPAAAGPSNAGVQMGPITRK